MHGLVDIVSGPSLGTIEQKSEKPKSLKRKSRTNSRERMQSQTFQNPKSAAPLIPKDSEEEKALINQLSVIDDKLSSRVLSDKYLMNNLSKQYATLGKTVGINQFQI